MRYDNVLVYDIGDNPHFSTIMKIQIMHVVSPPGVQQRFVLPFQAFTSIDLQTFSFGLSFDPSLVKAIDVEYGDFLSKGGADLTTCETPVIDTAKGRITGIACRRNTEDGVTGSGILVNVNFEAIAPGELTLKIENESFIQPNGDVIEFGFSDQKITIFRDFVPFCSAMFRRVPRCSEGTFFGIRDLLTVKFSKHPKTLLYSHSV